MRNEGYLKAGRNEASDNVFTPFYAVEPLLKYLSKDKVIWCPFDEEWSAYYQLFKENGYNVIRSSIEEGQNFFEYEPQEHWDIIISNPPFSKKDNVLKRLYSFKKPFAILLPLTSLQGGKRYNFFKYGIQLLAFDKRINYHTRNNFFDYRRGNHFASAYFCKDFLPNDLILEELKEYHRSLK